jgi:Flp pilus assembly protein TadD
MKRSTIVAVFLGILFCSLTNLIAQTDEVRRATGLPIPIGAPVIYGKVSIKSLSSGESKPLVFVSLIVGGIPLDRRQTNDEGFYYFLTSPRDGATLVFEVNGSEIGRMVLSATAGTSVRQDISFDWAVVRNALTAKPSVVSSGDVYSRTTQAQLSMESGMTAVKSNDLETAMNIFSGVLEKDPKDYVVWTEVGTLYFKKSQLDNAEACYFKAIALKKDYPVALLNLGKLYVERNQWDNAILVLTNAVSAAPDSADAHHYLGESYLQAKKGSLAVFHLNEAIKLEPESKAELHLRLAALYDAAGEKGRASAEYKMFLERRPRYEQKAQLEKYIAEHPPK